MLEIKDIVNVVINRETTSKTIRDLQTIAVLSVHDNFAPTETYRIYSSTTEMLDDGFTTSDYAYVAANRIFSQNPQVRNIVVGMITQGQLTSIDYVAEIRKLQAATQEWFFLITDAVKDADKEAIADYIETQTAIHVLTDRNSDTLNIESTTDLPSKLKAKGLQHTIAMYRKDSAVAPEAAWVGRFASAIIGSNTWIRCIVCSKCFY